jgi:DNA-binding MarR family transcriptional regulator
MAAGLLLVSALLMGLAPTGGDLPVPETEVAPGGLVSVAAGDDGLEVATELPVPVGVDGVVDLPVLPGLSVKAGPEAAAAEEQGAPATASRPGRFEVLRDAPPGALVAGSSLLATALAFAVWLAKPALGLFSRIEDDALATHPLRRQALDLIAANPGATLQDVRRGLGVAWGTAVYHLGRLERAGLVAVRHREGRRGHWPLGQAPPHNALPPTSESLARLVRDRPGLPQNELARLAGIGPPTACKQLRRLETAGYVAAHRSGKTRLYTPTASLDTILAKAAPA